MADVVNLRTVRKQVARQKRELQAEANRLAHGISTAERARAQTERDKAARDIDGHKRESGDRK